MLRLAVRASNNQAVRMRMLSTRRATAILVTTAMSVFILLAGGCAPVDTPGGSGGASGDASAAAPPGTVDSSTATKQLAGLKVATPRSMAGYSRDRFPHWRSVGGGCDTRDAVLKRDGKGLVVSADCKISKGSWFSWYDAKTYTSTQTVDIDHVVPLANAWRSGADAWTDAQRGDFANDMTRPQLLAVSASLNRAKGDQDPSQWKPPNHGYWCEYAVRWVTVKTYYHLTITQAEKTTLADMLATCH